MLESKPGQQQALARAPLHGTEPIQQPLEVASCCSGSWQLARRPCLPLPYILCHQSQLQPFTHVSVGCFFFPRQKKNTVTTHSKLKLSAKLFPGQLSTAGHQIFIAPREQRSHLSACIFLDPVNCSQKDKISRSGPLWFVKCFVPQLRLQITVRETSNISTKSA